MLNASFEDTILRGTESMINWPFSVENLFPELLGYVLRAAVWALFAFQFCADLDFEFALVPVRVPVLRIRVLEDAEEKLNVFTFLASFFA